jgi:hypothetical protein
MLKELIGDGMMRKLYCLCACLLLLACSIPVFPLVMASFIQVSRPPTRHGHTQHIATRHILQ